MSNTFRLNKHCKTCNCIIADKNKTSYCNIHRPRSGENNSMYGRDVRDYMTPEKQKQWIDNLSKASKKNWQNDEYRDRVVNGATGLTRSEEFKKGQSERTKQSYINNPDLRKQRGKIFKECWGDGRTANSQKIINRSKGEIELFDALYKIDGLKVDRRTIKTINGKYYYPDITVNDDIIVEFYGDYYHANPEKYKDDFFISKLGMTAKDVREKDMHRQKDLESTGFKFIVVWHHEWTDDRDKVLRYLVSMFTEHSHNILPPSTQIC